MSAWVKLDTIVLKAIRPPAELVVSESEGRELSEYFAALKPLARDRAAWEIFDEMLRGRIKYRGIPLRVERAPTGLQPGCLNRVYLDH